MKHFVVILSVLFSFQLVAQEVQQQDVKVGLVLSGGGAKGLAHIGALKVLDSLGVRVDYVAGTSMGAIIGSLYASGYSGKELDSIFREVNFDDIINDNLPREAKTFYERDNSEKYIITLPFDGFKVKLPSALSRGQNTYNLLSRLTLHVSEIEDFSKLPIPFFCMATNIETGEGIMMESGNLAQAVMASGALPSLFQPVVINDKILIDGGVVNNYPIDELRAKGVDIIIGVDVQDGLATKEELNSAPDILLQINNYRTINDMKKKAKKTDVYIKPDIKDFTVVSFSEGSEIIENGEMAANKHLDTLKNIANSQQKKNLPVNKKHLDSIVINSVSLSGNDKYTRAYVLGKLKLKPNKKVSYKAFSDGINNLVATNNFDNFYYQLKPNPESDSYDMGATLNESKRTMFIRLSLHYDDLYKSAALVNLTKRQLLTSDDVASLDLILGDNLRYNFEYFIDKGFYWSIGLRSRFNQFHQNITASSVLSDEQIVDTGLNKLDVELNDFTNQLYLQTLFRKDFALSLGVEHKHLKITSETLVGEDPEDKLTFENSDYLSLFGRLKLDTYDSKYFPTDGFYFDGSFNLYVYSSDFNNNFSEFSIAKAKFGYAQRVFGNLVFNTTFQGGFKVGEDENPYFNFSLGGYGNDFINNMVPFYGFDFVSLSGDSFVKAEFKLDYEIFKKHHVNFAANFANIQDDIFETSKWLPPPDYSGYAIGYSIESFLGPIELKYTWSPENTKNVWFLNVGFWF